jgi:hypothetical protein
VGQKCQVLDGGVQRNGVVIMNVMNVIMKIFLGLIIVWGQNPFAGDQNFSHCEV